MTLTAKTEHTCIPPALKNQSSVLLGLEMNIKEHDEPKKLVLL